MANLFIVLLVEAQSQYKYLPYILIPTVSTVNYLPYILIPTVSTVYSHVIYSHNYRIFSYLPTVSRGRGARSQKALKPLKRVKISLKTTKYTHFKSKIYKIK